MKAKQIKMTANRWRLFLMLAASLTVQANSSSGEQELANIRAKAETGDANAQFELGYRHSVGKGVKTNFAEAVNWYRKAAEQGDARAQNNLGVSYETGAGVAKNEIEAAKWYQEAASRGFADAQLVIGYYYQTGKGVAKNEAEAVSWYYKAAAQGKPEAQYNLADCYETGRGIAKNPVEAVKWYKKAAFSEYDQAQHRLGYCYDTGTGVPRDEIRAVDWYRKAANQMYAPAQHNLGICYAEGKGVAKNLVEAAQWYHKAADQGVAEAQYNLGVFYYEGLGVKKNLEEAVRWFRKGAEQGFLLAQNNLGYCYANGEGVSRDLIEAYKWWFLVREKNDSVAGQSLVQLEGWMTKEQIVEANRRVRAFKMKLHRGNFSNSAENLTENAAHTDAKSTKEIRVSSEVTIRLANHLQLDVRQPFKSDFLEKLKKSNLPVDQVVYYGSNIYVLSHFRKGFGSSAQAYRDYFKEAIHGALEGAIWNSNFEFQSVKSETGNWIKCEFQDNQGVRDSAYIFRERGACWLLSTDTDTVVIFALMDVSMRLGWTRLKTLKELNADERLQRFRATLDSYKAVQQFMDGVHFSPRR
jgi:TPR repeat protein